MLSLTRGVSPSMLEKSIIVVAHPDDEVLWFSSILDKVSEVVVCFLDAKRFPQWAIGRRKSLEEYPIKNISCLNIVQADVFNAADWQNPIATDYGIEIVDRDVPNRYEGYVENFNVLKQQLEKQLAGFRNVFTHNPWGEYGHEEHVQVHRVIKGLQDRMGFDLWYSNYVGQKSYQFMLRHCDRVQFEYVTCVTNRALAYDIKEVYRRNKCWTWHDHWKWPKKESFIKENPQAEARKHGRPFPTNFIRYSPPPSYSRRIKGTVKRSMKAFLKTFGIQITRLRIADRERVVSLHPEHTPQGTVLLSWVIAPFFLKPGEPIPNSHTEYWECLQVAQTFLNLGYAVDVIDSHNKSFQPSKPYAFFVGHRMNFDRLTGLLKRDCIKVAYLDTANWVFNNHATYRRKLELQQRRRITLSDSHRLIEINLAIERADYGVTYGNQFSLGTYQYANKPLFRVPISTCVQFPWPESKEHGACRANFLWFGSHGFVHKGLDLVLEAFADMPEYHLYVCGPLEKEKEFDKAYYRELYLTSNIHPVGWVDVDGPEFLEVANKCLGVVYPSCSESGGGSVIACLHAGLIPIVSYESSVDVEDFGVVLQDCSIQTIQETVRKVSQFPADRLHQMARRAWEHARATHTRETFADGFKKIVTDILEKIDRPTLVRE